MDSERALPEHREGRGPASGRTPDLRGRLRAALPAAMKQRDAVAVAALRSALAAIDNAEAVDADQAPPPVAHAQFAGTVAGLRAGEVERRRLSGQETFDIVRKEVADRETAARDYDRAGEAARADRLRAEAAVLTAHLA